MQKIKPQSVSRVLWILLSIATFVVAMLWHFDVPLPVRESSYEVIRCGDFSDKESLQPRLNLSGNWKFSLGDNSLWARPDWDDSNWRHIQVPGSWEEQGLGDYNGFGWYRTEFVIPEYLSDSHFTLHLGEIDDADEVYLNGTLIGSTGGFPPNYHTAYNQERAYSINPKFLNADGENILAIRVYDAEEIGGILGGRIGLTVSEPPLLLDMDLSGIWDFILENKLISMGDDVQDSDWDQLKVPGYWEQQGYPDYNGFAWYRKTVVLPDEFRDEPMVLVLGRIDDLDQVYVNGRMIGSLGNLECEKPVIKGKEWRELRGYYIPDELLVAGRPNLITVRVYDGLKDGGIYEGPIGLITQQHYIRYWKAKRRGNSSGDTSRMN